MNRFTAELDALTVVDIGRTYERIDWATVPYHWISLLTEFESPERNNTDLKQVVGDRALFFAFLAEMSDEDLKECFGI